MMKTRDSRRGGGGGWPGAWPRALAVARGAAPLTLTAIQGHYRIDPLRLSSNTGRVGKRRGSAALALNGFSRLRDLSNIPGGLHDPLDHLGVLPRAGSEHVLDRLNRLLYLLVTHRLNATRMLDFHIPRAQQCQQLTVSCRLVLAHLSNCRWTAVPEVSEQGRNKLAVQLLAVREPSPVPTRRGLGNPQRNALRTLRAPPDFYSRRQLFAKAAIVASRVAS
jgi:hypothetical protein